MKLDWDEEFPSDIKKKWLKWISKISQITNLSFPRCIFPSESISELEMHVFSDASSIGYASVCYCRFKYNGVHVLKFLFDKRKVCLSNNKLTIPKLELLAAFMSIRVASSMLKEVPLNFLLTGYWTDSMAVLQLIRNTARCFDVFVANRLSMIHEFSAPASWKFCPTELNSAGIGTRFASPKKFEQFKSWFDGPGLLLTPECNWSEQPSNNINYDANIASLNIPKVENSELLIDPFMAYIIYYSTYSHFLRACCYIIRFF